MPFWYYPAVFFSSVLSAMGVGGGTLLLSCLALFSTLSPDHMRLINLTLFLPVAGIAVLFHLKAKLIDAHAAMWSIPAGLLGACIGFWISTRMALHGFRFCFAVFLLLLGLKELFLTPKGEKEGR